MLVLDIETQYLAQEVGGWSYIRKMRLAVAVTYDTQTEEYKTYHEEDIGQLLYDLAGRRIVGFNLLRFDFPVLEAYYYNPKVSVPIDQTGLPHSPLRKDYVPDHHLAARIRKGQGDMPDDVWDFVQKTIANPFPIHWWTQPIDMLAYLYDALRFRISLDDLCEVNLGKGKSGSGLDAVEWFRQGDIKRVEDYCRRDVALTWELYMTCAQQGAILFYNKRARLMDRLIVHWKLDASPPAPELILTQNDPQSPPTTA